MKLKSTYIKRDMFTTKINRLDLPPPTLKFQGCVLECQRYLLEASTFLQPIITRIDQNPP